jgi:hypothetical protein
MFRLSIIASLVAAAHGSQVCDESFTHIMQDMHDGDQKTLKITALPVQGYTYTLTPHGNNQTWVVQGEWNAKSCNCSVDFNVPGKPGPPPVPLSLTYYLGDGGFDVPAQRPFAVFSDPSGTIAAPAIPLNAWVAL